MQSVKIVLAREYHTQKMANNAFGMVGKLS